MTLNRSAGSFGSHADYNPSGHAWNNEDYLAALMMDFEDSDLEKRGMGYNLDGDTPDSLATKWEISTTVAPTNLTKSAHRFYGGAEQGALQWYMPSVTGQMYISFKYRIPVTRRAGKFFRIWGSSSRNIYWATGAGNPGDYSANEEYAIRAFAENMNAVTTEYDNQAPNMLNGVWNRIEFYLDQSSGLVTSWLNGQQRWSNNWLTSFMTTINTVDLGHMVDSPGRLPNDPATAEEWFADVYYDLTRNRFEVADNASWASRTRSEVQIPTSWGTTSVTFAINRGEHSSLSGKYLYHLDTSNTATRLGQFT